MPHTRAPEIQLPNPVAAPPTEAVPNPAPADQTPKLPANPAPAPAPVVENTSQPKAPVAVTNHAEYVSDEFARLNELAMQDSPEAHQQILVELKNPDHEIREAALDALKQANDRSVVPAMQQIADQTQDPAEKQAILDAIDFINLPSLTEYLHQHQKN